MKKKSITGTGGKGLRVTFNWHCDFVEYAGQRISSMIRVNPLTAGAAYIRFFIFY